MKITNKLICLLLALVMVAACFAGCNGETEETTDTQTETPSETTTEIPNSDVVEDGELRVLITADVHHTDTTMVPWYEVPSSLRMQKWVDAIKAEHAQKPFDLIIIAGDTSLDFYEKQGSYTERKVSTTDDLVKRFVSKLPKGVPVFIMPGNHEAYTNEEWNKITGQDRQQSYAIKGNLFIMLDTYAEEVGSKYDGNADYTKVDVGYVKEQMEAHPECSKVWLIAHYFDHKAESNEFKALVKGEKRIKGLFAGHLHKTSVIDMGSEYGNKKIAQLGNFSYSYYTAYPTGKLDEDVANLKNTFWGFRELNITSDAAISNYIIAKSHGAVYKEQPISVERRIVDSVRFY